MGTVRYVGLDVHKRHVTVAAVNEQQELVLPARNVSVNRFFDWAQEHLLPDDVIALEATSNSWDFHDRLKPFFNNLHIANPYKLKVISSSSHKTDRHDAQILAKMLAAQILPTVWVPPLHVRELRQLTQHRSQLVQERKNMKNGLHSILHKHNLQLPEGGPFSDYNQQWWFEQAVNPIDKLKIRHLWQRIQQLNTQIDESETLIAQESVSAQWERAMTLLMQIPGIGLYTGMTIVAAIGEIQRFATPQQLVGYAGLGARVRSSGQSRHDGAISKQGRKELRTALVESAWVAVRWSPYWRAEYQRLCQHLNKNKAIIAIARRLLISIWHIWSKQQVDCHANLEAVARYFMTWAGLHRLARSKHLTKLEFVRHKLALLGILEKVPSFQSGSRKYQLHAPG